MFDITWEFSFWDIIILIIVLIVVLMVFFLMKKRAPEGIDTQKVEQKWKEIEDLINKDQEAMWRVAIIEADNLLDYVLKGLVMPGETMGQRLKSACYKYQKLRQVWWAHKLRNTIVHESDYQLRRGEAKKAVRSFHSALKVLNVL